MSAESRYEIVIYWSDEDQTYVAEVPELPGCMSDGATYRDALAGRKLRSACGLKRRAS